MQKISFLFMIFILFSCKDKKTEDRYANIPFHQSKGTKNYEVVELNGGPMVYYDSIRKCFLVEGSKTYYKYSLDGRAKDSMDSRKVLMVEDPYTFDSSDEGYYTTWLENGDKTLKRFIDILPPTNLRIGIRYCTKKGIWSSTIKPPW